MSSFRQGEEVTLLIYADSQLIHNKQFYQSTGFKFQATKGVQYLLRFDKVGVNKLLLLHLNNFVSDDKLEDTLSDHTIRSHNERGSKVLGRLKVPI
jgi:hypothetical protein